MKKPITNLAVNRLGRLLLFSLILFLVIGTTCTNDLNNVGSDTNPSGAGIILVTGKPNPLFGNGSKLSEIQVTTGEFPDGSPIEFKLTGSGLPITLKGCLIKKGTSIVNGQAFASYLAGIFITSCSGTTLSTATVNVSATITRADGSGIKQSSFGQITLDCISITPPSDQDVTTNVAGDPLSQFLTLTFTTLGIPPGTTINFSVRDPGLGSVTPASTTVGGSEGSGLAIAQYTTVNGTGGTQVVTATIVLPNPSSIDPSCPDVRSEDRTITGEITITQTAPAPPTPTPPPPPPTITVTAAPNTLNGGEQAIVTAQTTNLPLGTSVCFDIPTNSTPASSVNPICAGTDASGKAITLLTAGNITTNQTIIVRAFVDKNGNTVFDGSELNDTTTVTITGAPPTITVAADPNTIQAIEQSVITATTTGLPQDTRVCFDFPANSNPASTLNKNCVATDSVGAASTVLTGGNVSTTQVLILRACVDANANNACDSGELNDTTSVTIEAPPPPTPAPT